MEGEVTIAFGGVHFRSGDAGGASREVGLVGHSGVVAFWYQSGSVWLER